jgi:hypothetical protein
MIILNRLLLSANKTWQVMPWGDGSAKESIGIGAGENYKF